MGDARTARRLGAGLLVLALGFVVLLVIRSDPEVPPEESSRSTFADDEPAEPSLLERQFAAETPPVVREPASAALPLTPPGPSAGPTSFRGDFQGPDGKEIRVGSARIVLIDSHGSVRESSVVDATSVSIPGLEHDVYRVQVTAGGHEHREQVFSLHPPIKDLRATLVLWPQGWVAVVVRTSDGRSFEEIATEIGIDGSRLFVDAFDVRTSREVLEDEVWALTSLPQPAMWRKPPLYQSWSLPGASVGSLQLLEPPPFWVGLAVHGVPLGWEMLDVGDREVVFILDVPMLEERLATVRLRVVDAPGGAPRSAARATLKADTSAHRRDSLSDVRPDPDGRVAFIRIVPGRYELTVEGDGALHQALLEIVPGENRDLGDIVLETKGVVSVHAVDESGNPAQGWVEIAPYRRGQNARDLYPPNLHRSLDQKGEFRLPMPSEVSIVRVTLADGFGQQTTRLSPSVLLDPGRPPVARLELAVRRPQAVRFSLPPEREPFVRVEVRDAIDLVVETPTPHPDSATVRVDLIPGRYSARRVDAEGRGLPATTFVVSDQGMDISLP